MECGGALRDWVRAAGAGGRSGAGEQVLDGVLDAGHAAELRALSDDRGSVVVLVDVDGLSHDQELPWARAAFVAEHLDGCLRCGSDAVMYRWLKAQLASAASRDGEQLQRLRRFADKLVDQAT